MKILIAEDDIVAQRILSVTLQKAGHEVIAANDGQQAWEKLVRQPVQVIISDWMMPNMSGLDLCRKVRSRRRKDYIYFILVTALSGQENHHEAIEAGVDDFLNKPLQQDNLLIRLRVAGRILDFINEIRELKRLLPICMYCKSIRDDSDYWHQIETYLHAQTGTDFSHSICPKCYEERVKPQLQSLQNAAAEGGEGSPEESA